LKRKLLLPLTLFTVALILIPSAYAQNWQLFHEDGYYAGTRTLIYKTNNALNGLYGWNISIENFTGYHASFNFSRMEMYKVWWSPWAEQNVWFIWEITSGTDSIVAQIEAKRRLDWWGLQDKLGITPIFFQNPPPISLDINDWYTYDLDARVADYFVGEYFQLKQNVVLDIIKLNETTIRGVVYIEGSTNTGVLDYNWTVPNGFCDNVLIKFYIKHLVAYGTGEFLGYLSDTIYTNEPYNPEIEYETVQAETFAELIAKYLRGIGQSIAFIPEAVKEMLRNSGEWLNFLTSILMISWSAVVASIHFLPAIILFWFVDAIGTSAYYGDLHPIGNCFMTIYNFVRAVISTIISLAQAVWDAITFWS